MDSPNLTIWAIICYVLSYEDQREGSGCLGRYYLLHCDTVLASLYMVCAGPEHIKEFATNKAVLDTFSGVSLKRSSLPGIMLLFSWIKNNQQMNFSQSSQVKSMAKLRVHSRDVESCRSDQLSKLIAEILNPGVYSMSKLCLSSDTS